jgi:hypothetical protein
MQAIRDRFASPTGTTKEQYRRDALSLTALADHLLNLLHEATGLGSVCREQLLFMRCRRCASFTEGVNRALSYLNRRHAEGRCTCYDGAAATAVSVPTDPVTRHPKGPEWPERAELDANEPE